MRINLSILGIAAVVGLLTASVALWAGDENKITMSGSTTVKPVADAAAKAFKESHAGAEIAVGGGGSGKGIEAVGEGKVTIGMSSRELKKEETEKYKDLVPVSIGLDGIAIVVNGDNAAAKITKAQLVDIYLGKITNWKELGGPDLAITLVCVGKEHGTQELFLQYTGLEGKEEGEGDAHKTTFMLKGKEEPGKASAKTANGNQEMVAAVIGSPGAIGYVSIGYAQTLKDKGAKIKPLVLEDVEATEDNVKTGKYPIRRPLIVITKGAAAGAAKGFIDFLLSEAGQKIVKEQNYIPIK